MTTSTFRRLGKSVLLAIPSPILASLNWNAGDEVYLAVSHGCLVVHPKCFPHYTRTALLREMGVYEAKSEAITKTADTPDCPSRSSAGIPPG